jgi:hypothetical protein
MFNLRPSETTVTFGNGEQAKAVAVGSVILANNGGNSKARIILEDVLYVPTAAANLFSIPHAAIKGAQFIFNMDSCFIKFGDHILAEAKRHNGLYCINGTTQESALLTATKESPELWHRRFGHLGYDNLAKLRDKGMVSGINVQAQDFKAANSSVCEPCIMAKQSRAPFNPSESQSTKPLQLVHMDVCGPMPEQSLGGSNYIATFLDDYSKLSVVRPITRKSEVASVTQEVIAMLENQTGNKLQTVRTDNGTEYVNSTLNDYFKSKGVLHQTSVPYTPRSGCELCSRTRTCQPGCGQKQQ